MTDAPPPVPGWYPDPSGAPQTRWWDGSEWTAATQLGTGPGAPVTKGKSPATAIAVGVGAAVLLVVLALVGGVLLLRGANDVDVVTGSSGTTAEAPPEDLTYAPPEPLDGPVPGAPVAGCDFTPSGRPPARPVEPPTEEDVVTEGTVSFTFQTSAGPISFDTDAARTPCAVGSLRNLVEQGYFDGTSCHRLTTEGIHVLQCGDPTGTGSGGPGYAFADEALDGATYPRGTVAMANAGPGTNGSQFFLVYQDAALPPSYTPLGTITEGLEAIDEVAAAGTQGGGTDGTPATPVRITGVTADAG